MSNPESNPEAGRASGGPACSRSFPREAAPRACPRRTCCPSAGSRWSPARCASACAAKLVTDVVVSTDDQAIAAAARPGRRRGGAASRRRHRRQRGDLPRPPSCTPWSHDAARHQVDVVLLVQCTSPFIVREEHRRRRQRGRAQRRGQRADRRPLPRLHLARRRDDPQGARRAHGEAERAAPGHRDGHRRRRLWRNHDKSFRPRRQDRRTSWRPAPSTPWTRTGFRQQSKHRFFGHTEPVRTDPARVLEIDDPHDLARARALATLFDANRPGALPTAEGHRRGRTRLRRHPDRRPGADRLRRTGVRLRAPR